MFLYCLKLAFSICIVASTDVKINRPHIILIMADDLGWNDVSFHGSPQIPTPNIDALAFSGITLERHYSAPLCTPTRASLMTGRVPSNTGLSHSVIISGQALALSLNFTLMPEYFKELGYTTHLVGKWHLGCHKKKYTPVYRGFDTAFGCWNGEMDYYDYTSFFNENTWGIDLHYGMRHIKHLRGEYATDVFTKRAEDIIKKHNRKQPLFLYFAHIAPHTGNDYQPLQGPLNWKEDLRYIKNRKRRIYAAQVLSLDRSVGRVFAALHESRMLDNSIIIFMSDNGAPVSGQRNGEGSNAPLRGSKASVYEGGVRVPALIWSPHLGLSEACTTTHALMHVCDWLSTLYAAAGGNVESLGNVDSINMWPYLKRRDIPPPRNEIFLYRDTIVPTSSLIQNDYKIINGSDPNANFTKWYDAPGSGDLNVPSLDKWVYKNGSLVRHILQKTGRWLVKKPDQCRRNAAVNCGAPSPPSDNGGCNPLVAPCLFNITEDPCEYRNLATERPQVVEDMMNRIRELGLTGPEQYYPDVDPKADPRCYDFTYVTWLDPEYASRRCSYAD